MYVRLILARLIFGILASALASLPGTALAQKVTKLTPQDRIEIQELTDGYTYKIDYCTNSGYDYADMYTEDGTFGVASEWGGANVKWWYRGREELAVAAGGGKDGCRPKQRTAGVQVHHIATSLVVTPTATGARGKSTLLATGVGGNPVAIEWQGGYEDEYVKTPKGWKFKSRVHVWPEFDWPNTPAEMAARRAAATAAPPASVQPQMRGDGPPPQPKGFNITRADPALDALVDANAKADLMADGFGLNEGPVWIPEGLNGTEGGHLLIGGLLDNVIYKITQDNRVSVFLDNAGFTGNDANNTGTQTRSGRSHVLLVGPSCASLDSQGRLVWCADNDRAVMRLEKDGKTRTLLAGGSGGKRFSGPNDIVIRSDDAVFLTDNDFGLRGAGKSPLKELPNGIWMMKDGTARMVLDATALGGTPNGIALSPDERYLYLTAGRKMQRYELRADGTLGNSTLFAEGDGIGDGIKVDVKGNVFSSGGAGPGIIRVTSAEGRFLGLLHLPIYGGEPKKQICATNIAFGGKAARTLFVTACDAVYKIETKTTGLLPGPKR